MKKLTKTQKEEIKKISLKYLNIACYVISGISLVLGSIIFVKACSDKKRESNNSVATTPVVHELIDNKKTIEINGVTDSDSLSTYDAIIDYMRYIDNTTYEFDMRDAVDYVNWPTGYTNKTLIDFGVGNNAISFNENYRDDEAEYHNNTYTGYKLVFGSNCDLRLYDSASHYNLLAFSRYYDYEGVASLTFTTPNDAFDYDYFPISILPHLNLNNPCNELDNLLVEHLASYTSGGNFHYSYYNNQTYRLGDYIFPYGVYGNTSITNDNATLLNKYGVYPVFYGSFSCNGQNYDTIYVRTIGFDVRTILLAGTIQNYSMVKDVVFSSRSHNHDVVVASSNYGDMPTTQFTANSLYGSMRLSYVDDVYKTITLIGGYYGYERAFNYSLQNDALLGLSVDFSFNFNNYTGVTGSINSNGESGYDNIPDYNTGDNVGQPAWNSVFGLLGMAFTSMASIFGYQILPGVSIGTLLFLPLVVTIVIFIIWLIKR